VARKSKLKLIEIFEMNSNLFFDKKEFSENENEA